MMSFENDRHGRFVVARNDERRRIAETQRPSD